MPTPDRDQAIAIAEARLRDAALGEPELLGAHRYSANELSEATKAHVRSLGGTDEQIEKVARMLSQRPPRTAWHVQFLLHDPGYVGGVTIATVRIDDATGRADVDVFQRDGRTAG